MKVRELLLAAVLLLSASVARAEVVNVSDDHGGLVASYQSQWQGLAARGKSVRIVGPCVSACTILVGYIPRERICVMPGAYFGFHWATTQFHTQELWSIYPADIRQWMRARRAHQSVDMAASASHLPLFPQVRRERSRHVNSEAPPKLIFAGGPSILTFVFEPDEARCEMLGCDHRPMRLRTSRPATVLQFRGAKE
jgi:hypothetical protein